MKNIIVFTISLFILLFSQCKKEDTNSASSDLNNSPIIVHIDNLTIRAAETDTILIQAVDKDGLKLNFSLLTDPGFLTLIESTHSGNTSNALLVVHPNEEVLGEFYPEIHVENENGVNSQTSFKIEVIEVFSYDIDDNIVKNVDVNLVNTSDYEVQSAYICRSNYTSPYIYGLVKLHYIGNVSRNYIKIDALFQDEEGNTIFSDESYLKNETAVGTYSFNTNSFVSPSYNLGYYTIIENLDRYNSELSDIASVEIEISSSSYEYQIPFGELSKVNEPYQITDDSWYLDIKNTGIEDIEIEFNTFIYKDNQEREYKWSYPDIYIWNEDQEEFIEYDHGCTLSYGTNSYLESLNVSPDYWESNPLQYSKILMNWDPSTKKSTSLNEREKLKTLKLKLSSPEINTDLRNILIKEYNDDIFKLKH